MNYKETITYLYNSMPVYQHIGAEAYKPGLFRIDTFNRLLGRPHDFFQSIHVAGTNGKGTVCHLLAAILQKAGYKVGLFTSPHLVDFRERIRVNGEPIEEDYVTDFVEHYRQVFEPLHPSFFELATGMAFSYFRDRGVHFAIVETGMGGRLDSTNIITPMISAITSISMDHMAFLGNTLEMIAGEKAGIIKHTVPVVIGDEMPEEVVNIIRKKAVEMQSEVIEASQKRYLLPLENEELDDEKETLLLSRDYGELETSLTHQFGRMNAATALAVVKYLVERGVTIPKYSVREAFKEYASLTGLHGRWEVVMEDPLIVLDTGHNPGAWKILGKLIEQLLPKHKKSYLVLGFSNDKDVESIIDMLPDGPEYIFTQAALGRAMSADELSSLAEKRGICGKVMKSTTEAVCYVADKVETNDFVFIGGSNFVIAEALPYFQK